MVFVLLSINNWIDVVYIYYRLERILRRRKFEEAERFATTFSLDHQIVYKAHVQHLCQELSPWSTSMDNEVQIFNKILELIKKIKVSWLGPDLKNKDPYMLINMYFF